MPSTSESIDQLIEESYLLGLTQEEIRADLDRFVEVCGKVIRQNVQDRKQMQDLAQQLARARALSLIEDQREDDDEAPVLDEQEDLRSAREAFAEKVARNKCLILRTIRDCNPKLPELIERERYPILTGKAQPAAAHRVDAGKTARSFVFKIFYAVTLAFVLLLIYLVLLQQNF